MNTHARDESRLRTRGHAPLRRDRGVALILTLLILVALTPVGLYLLNSSTSGLKHQARTTQFMQCLNVASQGNVEGTQQLPQQMGTIVQAGFVPQTSQVLDTGTGTLGSAGYAYQLTVEGSNPSGLSNLSEQDVTMRSTCRMAGSEVSVVSRGSVGASSVFSVGACACTDLEMNSNYRTDAYDSAAGTYGSQTPTQEGHVGANRDIVLDSNALIQGTATAGDDISHNSSANVTGATSAGDNNSLGGASNVTPAPVPCSCNEFDLSGAISAAYLSNDNTTGGCSSYISGTDFEISSNDSCTLAAGTYYFTSFKVDSNAHVTIAGPVEMYWVGNGGPFEILSNAHLNSNSDSPENLQIFSNTTETIKFDSNVEVSAYIYAPDARFEHLSNAHFYGALTADEVFMDSNAEFHFDKNATRQDHLPGEYVASTWRVDL